jgi:DNA-binding transcriptional LysR family regulator
VHLEQIAIFVEIARQSGISAAARQLGMPKSRVSKALAALEARLGVRLVERTSRKFRLTDLGEQYAQRAQAAISELSEAELLIEASRAQPSGRLCISAPIVFGQTFLGSILADFARRYPNVDLEVRLENRVVDVVEEGVDVAIRSGRLPDSSLIARPLDTARLQLAARAEIAASLLAHTEPSQIAAIPIIQAGAAGRSVVLQKQEGQQSVVQIAAFPSFNDIALARSFAENGDSVVLLPSFLLREASDRGRLCPVLPDWHVIGRTLHVVYPSRRALSPKINAFVDLLVSASRSLTDM